MAAFTFFVKEHFNPVSITQDYPVWHSDIGLQKSFDDVSRLAARVTSFSRAITPPLVSKFCDLQMFGRTLASRFMQKPVSEPLFSANDDIGKLSMPKRNLFQPYRFR